MAALITKYLNKYVRRVLCLIFMFSFDHGFLILTWSTGPMKWYTGNSYQAEALTNVLRYHTCRSSLPEDRKLPITYLCFHPLPVPMAALITKYLNKYVRRVLCLIFMFSFYFWSPSLARKMRKSRGVLTILLYIFITQRHVQTFWGIIHVCQAILETGRGRKLSHNGCTAANFVLPINVQ
jgi:hypothetical protein